MEPGPGTTAWLPSPAPWALVGCVVWAGDPLWAHNVHWVPTHGLDTVGVGRSGAGQPPEGTFLLPSRTQSTGQGSCCPGAFGGVRAAPCPEWGAWCGGSWLQGSVLCSENRCVKDKSLALKGDAPGKFKLPKKSGKELPEAVFLTTAWPRRSPNGPNGGVFWSQPPCLLIQRGPFVLPLTVLLSPTRH